MAQAAGLYLHPFPRYRQWNDRNRLKFLIPGPLKICKKSIVPYENSALREKIRKFSSRLRNIRNGREN